MRTCRLGLMNYGLAALTVVFGVSAFGQEAILHSKGVTFDGQTFDDWLPIFQSGTKSWPRNPDYNNGSSVYFATRLTGGTSNQTLPAGTPLFVSLGSGVFVDDECDPELDLLRIATDALDNRMIQWDDRRVWLDGVPVDFDHEASRLELEFDLLHPPGTEIPCNPGEFSTGPLAIRAASAGIFALIPPLDPGPHILKYGHSDGSFRYRRFTVLDGQLGDLDRSGILDAADIDMISRGVREGSIDLLLDVDRNGAVDPQDRTHWVESLAETFLGDANLDKDVNFQDFIALASAFNDPGGWGEGDFDGNGEIEFNDFLLLSGNFGRPETIGEVAASVPEPAYSTFGVAVMMMTAIAHLRSRRRAV